MSEDLKGKLLGLCGKYDGTAADDFTDQQYQLLTSPGDFGSSWKRTLLGEARELLMPAFAVHIQKNLLYLNLPLLSEVVRCLLLKLIF